MYDIKLNKGWVYKKVNPGPNFTSMIIQGFDNACSIQHFV